MERSAAPPELSQFDADPNADALTNSHPITDPFTHRHSITDADDLGSDDDRGRLRLPDYHRPVRKRRHAGHGSDDDPP